MEAHMQYRLTVTNAFSLDKEQQIALGFDFDENEELIDEWDELYTPLYVEISTIEELQTFIKRYGRVVLNKNTIEIYNGFRE
jgi:hypothetical protein